MSPSLGAATFHLKTDATAFEAGLAKAKGSAAASSASIQKSMNSMNKSTSGISKSMTSLGATMSRRLTIPIVAAGAIVGKFAVDFDREMRNVNSIAQLPERELENLRKEVLKLSGHTAQAPKVLAESMYTLVSSGFDSQEALTILGSSAKAATAGLTTAEVATSAVAAVLNAYRMPAKKAGDVSDILFRTVDRGVISFEQLASTVGDVLPFASSLSIPLQDVGASVATMTKAGISAPETMTRIKSAMMAFIKPSKAMKAELDEQGFKTGEAMIHAKGFQGALDALAKSTGGNKEEMGKLFPNVRALGGALALTGKNSRGANQDLAGLKDSAGATDKALSQQRKSVSHQMKELSATLQAAAVRIGDVLLPVVVPIFKAIGHALIDMADQFNKLPGPVKTFIVTMLLMAAVAGPVVAAVGFMGRGLMLLVLGIGKVMKAIKIFFLLMRAAPLLLGPWGIAIAAIIAAAILIVMHWDKVKAALLAAWNWIKNAAMTVFPYIKKAAELGLLGPIGLIIAHWTTIKNALVATWNWIKTAAGNVFRTLKPIVMAALAPLLAYIKVWIAGIKVAFAIFKVIFAVVKLQFRLMYTVIKAALTLIVAIVKFAFKTMVTVIRTLLRPIIAYVKFTFNTIKSVINAVKGPISSAAKAIGKALSGPFNTAKSLISKAVGTVKSVLSSLGGFFSRLAGGAFKTIKDAIKAIVEVLEKIVDAANSAKDALDSIDPSNLDLPDLSPGFDTPLGAKGGKFVAGTSRGGNLAVVGEKGPELVSLPGGSYVHSNTDSRRMIPGFAKGGRVGKGPSKPMAKASHGTTAGLHGRIKEITNWAVNAYNATITDAKAGRSYPSLHPGGYAVDLTSSNMSSMFRGIYNRYGTKNLNQLFYDPIGWHVYGGRKVSGAFGDHDDHVHAGAYGEKAVGVSGSAGGGAGGGGGSRASWKTVTASMFGGPGSSDEGDSTASGKKLTNTLRGWAELSNDYWNGTGADFSALGKLPMGTMLSIRYGGKTVRAPKVDVGAGGKGIGGFKRAVDLTYATAQDLNFSGLHNVKISRTGGGGGGLGSNKPDPNKSKQAQLEYGLTAAKTKAQKLRALGKLITYWRGRHRQAKKAGNWRAAKEALDSMNDYKEQKREVLKGDKELYTLGGLTKIGKGKKAYNIGGLQTSFDHLAQRAAEAALTVPAPGDDTQAGLKASLQDDISAANDLVSLWRGIYVLASGKDFEGVKAVKGVMGTGLQITEAATGLKGAKDTLQGFLDEANQSSSGESTDQNEAAERFAELYKQQRDEAWRDKAILNAQIPIFRKFFPAFGGSFKDGGIVPGPQGAPRTVIAHGGEAIGEPAGPVQVNVIVEDGAVDARRIRAEVGEVLDKVGRKARQGPTIGRRAVAPR